MSMRRENVTNFHNLDAEIDLVRAAKKLPPETTRETSQSPSSNRQSETPTLMKEDPPEPKQKYQLLSKLSSIEDIGSKILKTAPLSELLSVSSDLSTFIHDQTQKQRVPIEAPRG